MPNCFSLTRRSNLEAGAVPLAQIDNEICAALFPDTPGLPDPVQYVNCWYDMIGFRLACGKSFPEVIESLWQDWASLDNDPERKAKWCDWYMETIMIAEWLDKHFTSDAWAEIGKR